MLTVHEVSELTGVSVRALQYYDEIGLLKPIRVPQTLYRLYDDENLARLQTILLFRELKFPLKEIKTILDSPSFDRKTALCQQRDLLLLQRKRLDELITFAEKIITTGVNSMDFSSFDKSEIKKYEAEAKERWGTTDAYKEFEEKQGKKTEGEQRDENAEFMKQFELFGAIKASSPESEEAFNAAKSLQGFISEHYYTCTPEILQGLGAMYVSDELMKANIDKVGGEGTAEFASKAIAAYCTSLCD